MANDDRDTKYSPDTEVAPEGRPTQTRRGFVKTIVGTAILATPVFATLSACPPNSSGNVPEPSPSIGFDGGEETPTPSGSFEPTPTPTGSSEPTPTPTATVEPTPSPSATDVPPTPTPSSSSFPVPTPTPTPSPSLPGVSLPPMSFPMISFPMPSF